MVDTPKPGNPLGERLLREETINESEYEEYRMHLELALNRAERFERITFHVCWISFLLAFGLMFVGGSQVVGAFDPYDKDANALSITLGVVYVLACIAWPISLASVYSRWRPRIRNLKHEISEAKIDRLESKIEELQDEVGNLREQRGE